MAAMGNMKIRRLTSAVGALIEGVDLTRPVAPETVPFLSDALAQYGVIFFRNQDMTHERFLEFLKNLGQPQIEEATGEEVTQPDQILEADLQPTKHATAVWHADTTFLAEPPKATALRAIQPPEFGGDTCWASMYAAYDALSEPMRDMLDGLTAVHSTAPVLERMGEYARFYLEKIHQLHPPECVHPVIRVHPETGRKALYVSESWTTRIVELTPAESRHVLAMLFEHVKSPDFAMRWHWERNDLAVWDNCSVQHYAVPDYTSSRVMQRVTLAGDRPYGPQAGQR